MVCQPLLGGFFSSHRRATTSVRVSNHTKTEEYDFAVFVHGSIRSGGGRGALSTLATQYWAVAVWTGKWCVEEKEAWMNQVFCPPDPCGHHRAACPRAGVLGRRGYALESVLAGICREAGGRVTTNILVRDLDLEHLQGPDVAGVSRWWQAAFPSLERPNSQSRRPW